MQYYPNKINQKSNIMFKAHTQNLKHVSTFVKVGYINYIKHLALYEWFCANISAKKDQYFKF